MFYMIASDYNKKLYHHVTSKGLSVQYVQSLEHLLLDDDDTVIGDEHSQESELLFSATAKNFKRILMSDQTRTQGSIKFVSKYQPIESICFALFDRQNLLVILIGEEALFKRVIMDSPNCNFIDFTYTPDSNLSLIQILDKCEIELLKSLQNSKSKILYPITNVMDLLDPPINYIKPLMDKLVKSRDTIVRIDHLKGPLDLMLLNLSELVIIVHETIDNRNKRFDSSIEKIINHKNIISLNISTKAYEQFKLSDFMIYGKES